MSQFMFGISRQKPTRKEAKIMERAAKAEGCDFIEADLPGTGYQRWFAGPNMGFPFDRDMANRVKARIEKAGVR